LSGTVTTVRYQPQVRLLQLEAGLVA